MRELLSTLRARRGDFTEVEVKRARDGVPSLGPTLSAFGNMPEGGTIVLGLDEASGFAATGVDDAQRAEQAIASQARQAVSPALQVEFQRAHVDGKTILLADVAGLPLADRPCRAGGRAYLRQADGDYELSPQELQQIERAKLVGAEHPRDDIRPIDGSSVENLDPDLVGAFLSGVRASSPRLSTADAATVLRAKGVIEPQGDRLTLAGLIALGRYPQQFTPSYAITAAVQLPRGSGARTRDLVHLDGPLPDLLDSAIEWVRRNTSTRIRYDERGHARDENEFPARAVRELIANALVHRDLSSQTEGKRIEIRLTDDDLIITNPGGLRGITVRQLGDVLGKSAVNQYLYEIAKFTRIRDGARVIEGEGGGIREVRAALSAAGMRAPVFHDTGVAFVARVPRHAFLDADDLEWLATTVPDLPLTDLQRNLLVELRHGRVLTTSDVRERFGVPDRSDAQVVLQGLVETGLVERYGSGRGTTYRFADPDLVPDEMLRIEVEGPETRGRTLTAAHGRESRTTKHEEPILAALDEPRPLTRIAELTGLTEGQTRFALNRLISTGRVSMLGAQGQRGTVYARTDASVFDARQ